MTDLVLINSPIQKYSNVYRPQYRTTAPLGLGYLGTIARNGDNFLVINFVMEKEAVVYTPQPSGGGGGSCNPSFWDCPTQWSECKNNSQTKICKSNCGTTKTQNQSCNIVTLAVTNVTQDETEDIPVQSKGFFSRMTGAIAGALSGYVFPNLAEVTGNLLARLGLKAGKNAVKYGVPLAKKGIVNGTKVAREAYNNYESSKKINTNNLESIASKSTDPLDEF